jgi:hypothetical protein
LSSRLRLAVADNAADSADAARAAAPGRAHWSGTVGWPANAANDVPPGDNLRCNNVLGDGPAGTAVHSLSEDKADTDHDRRLVES